MENKHIKRCFTSYIIRDEIPLYLLEWPKSKTLKTPSASKDVKEQELSFSVGENAKWYSTFEEWPFLTN